MASLSIAGSVMTTPDLGCRWRVKRTGRYWLIRQMPARWRLSDAPQWSMAG